MTASSSPQAHAWRNTDDTDVIVNRAHCPGDMRAMSMTIRATVHTARPENTAGTVDTTSHVEIRVACDAGVNHGYVGIDAEII